MNAVSEGFYWVQVDGVRYVFQNHEHNTQEARETALALLEEYEGPIRLLNESPPVVDLFAKTR